MSLHTWSFRDFIKLTSSPVSSPWMLWIGSSSVWKCLRCSLCGWSNHACSNNAPCSHGSKAHLNLEYFHKQLNKHVSILILWSANKREAYLILISNISTVKYLCVLFTKEQEIFYITSVIHCDCWSLTQNMHEKLDLQMFSYTFCRVLCIGFHLGPCACGEPDLMGICTVERCLLNRIVTL